MTHSLVKKNPILTVSNPMMNDIKYIQTYFTPRQLAVLMYDYFFYPWPKTKNPFIFWPGPLLWQNKYLGYIPLLLGCRHILSHLFLLCLFKECRHDWPYANARGPASHNYIIKGFCIIHTYVVLCILYMYHRPPLS